MWRKTLPISPPKSLDKHKSTINCGHTIRYTADSEDQSEVNIGIRENVKERRTPDNISWLF